MSECRMLQENELPLAEKLWATCFEEDTEEFIKYYFKNCVDSNSFIGVFVNNALVSMLQIKEYDKEFQGSSITVGYLVGLCTHPDYRMRGLAKELIYRAFEVLKDRGIAFSRLYPFNYNFYKKFGYAICSDRQIVTINKEQFKQLETKGIETISLRNTEIDEYTCEMLNSYYAFFSRLSGYTIRDEETMKAILLRHMATNKAGIVVTKENGFITGYATYSKIDREIICDEVVYKDIRTFAAIANYLRNDRETVKLAIPPNEKIYMYMDDPLGCVQIEPHIMEKILDITESLPMLELADLNASVFVKITNINEHNDCKIYEINEHGIKSATNQYYSDFECDCGTYMQLVTGYIGCTYAIKKGLLIANNYERLQLFKTIFKENSVYVFEMF